MIKKVSIICGLIISISAVLGLIYALDSRWAKAEEMVMLSQRLDEKITSDRADRLQERIWKLEDRHGKTILQSPGKDEYRSLMLELEKINKKRKGEKR